MRERREARGEEEVEDQEIDLGEGVCVKADGCHHRVATLPSSPAMSAPLSHLSLLDLVCPCTLSPWEHLPPLVTVRTRRAKLSSAAGERHTSPDPTGRPRPSSYQRDGRDRRTGEDDGGESKEGKSCERKEMTGNV